MTRLLIHVEGQTEEAFVEEVLAPHLYTIGYTDVSARLMGEQRERDRRGGIRPWPEVRRGIINRLREDTGQIATTMIDYYGLPANGPRGWPGRADSSLATLQEKANRVENAIQSDVAGYMGSGFNPSRFVPYVMMHEFEAMLFSDCTGFAQAIARPDLSGIFQQIRDAFNTPEEIDDSPENAPSKRIVDLIPAYQKPADGTAAAAAIGLAAIRRECPHFARWLAHLENLATPMV